MRTRPNDPSTRPGPTPPPRWLLWGSFVSTPALWFAYFMLAYVFNEAACGIDARITGGIGVPVGSVLFVATVAVLLAVVAATVWTWRIRRRAIRTREVYDDFLPRVGFVMGLLVALVMVAHLIQITMIGVCG